MRHQRRLTRWYPASRFARGRAPCLRVSQGYRDSELSLNLHHFPRGAAAYEQALRLPNPLPFGYLGENIVLSGIPKLSQLPPRTKIFFRKKDGTLRTAVIVVWGENGPCIGLGHAIQSMFTHATDIAQRFPKAAIGIRGIVRSVYVSGSVEDGDTALVLLPEQRPYSPE